MEEFDLSVVDLVIKNGKIVTPNGIQEGGIGVDNGKILIIAKNVLLPKADITIDGEGKFVLPGLIDAHVHFRDPDPAGREDFTTGTMAAAAGGITTIFEMPFSTENTSSTKILEKRKLIAKKKSIVDFAFYGGAGSTNIDEIAGLARAGVIGFKTMMLKPPKGMEKYFEGVSYPDDGSLYDIMKTVALTSLPHSFHAENGEIIGRLSEKLKEAGRKDYMAFIESRPNFSEAMAILKVIFLSKVSADRAHILHMSTKEGVQLMRSAKASGQRVTAETCPQYLLLTAQTTKDLGPYAVMNPPLRSKEDIEELWRGLDDGTIDIIATDHSPHLKKSKDSGFDDIWVAPPGNPGIETMLPLMLTKVNEGRITMEKLVKLTSESVSKIFHLYPKKGTIQVGSDADLVILDLKKEQKISSEIMHSMARSLSLYQGWKVKGLPVMTIVRGEIVMRDGEIIGKPGYGTFISPIVHQDL